MKFVYKLNKEDCDLFEELLNNYIVTEEFKQDIGTILREQDPSKFREYFDEWVKECAKKTRIISRTRCSYKPKYYYFNEMCTEEEIKKEGLKALRTMGIV